MTMINAIKAVAALYWLDILVIAAFIGALAYLYRIGKTEAVKKIIFYLVVRAEQQLGSGTGPLKYAMVIAAVYEKLPLILRLVFTKEDIDRFIEEAVANLKAYLYSGDVNLLTYCEELNQDITKTLNEKNTVL